MRRLVALIVVLAGLAYVAWQGVVVVRPHQAMIVSEGNRVVGVRSPGLNWHWPFIQNATLIDVNSVHRQEIKVDLELSDTSKCPVRVGLIYRIADPERAFKWRRANDLGVSRAQATSKSINYPEAGRAFIAALREAGKSITQPEANAGAIEKWISRYRPPIHKDGARTVDVQIESINCSQALAAARKEAERKRNRREVKGPAQTLSQHLRRGSIAPGGKVYVWSLQPIELVLSDGARALISELEVHVVITDRQKFEAAFGPRETNALRLAEVRSMHVVARAIRSIAGTLSESELRKFDPLTIVSDDQSLRQRFANLGLSVVDIGGQNPSYQMITYKYD